MKCGRCGEHIEHPTRYCPGCGRRFGNYDEFARKAKLPKSYDMTSVLEDETMLLSDAKTEEMGEGDYRPYYAPTMEKKLSFKEFFEKFADRNAKINLNGVSILCALNVGINLLATLFINIFALLDVVLYLTFGLIIYLRKSWITSLIFTVVSSIFFIISCVDGSRNGILLVGFGVLNMISLNKVRKEYKKYETTGILPEKKI